MSTPHAITPVILSGGSGTRLWPVSRIARPKQLLALTARETMLQLTISRTAGDERFERPVVVASAGHAEEIEAQLLAQHVADAIVILEPAPRNTAPAIALAAYLANADDLLLVMPSDHVISDAAAFHAAIERAIPAVQEGWLATFGIRASAPETGYGYICRGEAIGDGVFSVERFVEKPDEETARGYVDGGRHDWNGGIFLFTAGALIAALEAHAPAVAAAARAAMEGVSREGVRLHPDAHAFGASPSVSIDYAVMEKADRVAVVPVEMGWSDVGSWDALHALGPRDGDGNRHQGEVVAIDTRNCLMRSDGPLIAAVGVSNLIVVATADAVLVMPRGDSQEVRRAVEQLRHEKPSLL